MAIMNRIVRQLGRLLRLPALAGLLIAVIANPVLAAVGDVHEAARGTADHLHNADQHTLADESSRDGSPQGGDLLDALMHAAHCCGHLTAVTPAFVGAPKTAATALVPQTAATLAIAYPATSEIRPPIAL
ncbi:MULTISPECIES: hypothetical protein [Xanthomonas]|uniref:DUF2946 domain-containing protein n=2 Tax=Xanthomonas TaxID=338 RepID=A0A1V9HDC7_9XANT|nr:hypothetical protein [Xanthomonas phaseoli]MBO9778175.1 hypothetical protein [Xanthomonas phaseoli pv. dieffenbachiae]MBO9782087.1 hypothetical protein [Xanthomonas phaseoli pv. dieffenbachiae]MBO9805671.1 hypothetical protein [Xanthomonas phaseoli pv. dieffenbachiae]MBO9818424.1 hypothetical protein [Xanthomonas phaseoli pv. dieffenbachiae]MBO9822558.1 hypothetical protein [Xanthomonas phaseoli pv. dieffenbachiae]